VNDHLRSAGGLFARTKLFAEVKSLAKRHLVAALACAMLVAMLGGSHAAGLYDGEWVGVAAPTPVRCGAGPVTLTVTGKVVIGETRLGGDTLDIRGTVAEDGSFGATIGFRHLMGLFRRDAFEATYEHGNCRWKMSLERKK
jgi:hypothetical protein